MINRIQIRPRSTRSRTGPRGSPTGFSLAVTTALVTSKTRARGREVAKSQTRTLQLKAEHEGLLLPAVGTARLKQVGFLLELSFPWKETSKVSFRKAISPPRELRPPGVKAAPGLLLGEG